MDDEDRADASASYLVQFLLGTAAPIVLLLLGVLSDSIICFVLIVASFVALSAYYLFGRAVYVKGEPVLGGWRVFWAVMGMAPAVLLVIAAVHFS